MGCLSKNIFRLYASPNKTSNKIIRIYNSYVYHTPYTTDIKLSMVPPKYYYSPKHSKQVSALKKKLENLPGIVLAHGSLIKADMFADPGKFMAVPLQLMLRLYEKGPLFINNKLTKRLLETHNLPNNTRYYKAPIEDLGYFLNVNKGMYSFIAYT